MPPRRRLAIALALCALLLAALIARFDWLCDDAFISFRYARHLSSGLGLAYNPGERPPVEGYTNFLWVVWLALWERLGVEPPSAARATSVACAFALLLWLGVHLHRSLGGRTLPACLALAFFATFPPVAVWATGGLETLPFTLCVFAAWERLLGDPARPRGWQAGVAALAAGLLRADGAVWVGLLLASAFGLALARRPPGLLRAALAAAAIAGAGLGAHLLWRAGYHGALVPNTARVKVELGAASLERGLAYVGALLLALPSLGIALAASAPAARRDPARLSAAVLAGGTLAWAALVGGDFMAMGRFLVPAVPFATVLWAGALQALERRGGPAAAFLAGIAVAALSLLPAFDRHATPRSWRRALHFRWSAGAYWSEYQQWRVMRWRARQWALLGRALGRRTQPDESLVTGTIGAVGYYSGLRILDPFGLVNREAFGADPPSRRRSAGHQRRVPIATFLASKPTYLEARLVAEDEPYAALPRHLAPGSPLWTRARPEWHRLEKAEGAAPGTLLRLVRYAPEGAGAEGAGD